MSCRRPWSPGMVRWLRRSRRLPTFPCLVQFGWATARPWVCLGLEGWAFCPSTVGLLPFTGQSRLHAVLALEGWSRMPGRQPSWWEPRCSWAGRMAQVRTGGHGRAGGLVAGARQSRVVSEPESVPGSNTCLAWIRPTAAASAGVVLFVKVPSRFSPSISSG